MPDAVSPGRDGQAGVGGGQPAPGGPPAPQEAQKVVSKPFGASASDADPVAGLSDRAQERFRELTQRLKGAEEELARLRSQPPVPTQPRQPWEQAPSELDPYSKPLEDLRKMARKAMDSDPDQALSLIEQMAEIKATKAANQSLKGFFQEMQQREVETRFRSEADSAWQRAVQSFPELNDERTEFYQESKQMWENDPYLKQLPDGMYKAAQIAWSERARRVTRPASLETSRGTSITRVTASGDIQDDKAKTMEAMSKGDRSALEKFLTKHVDAITVRPNQ